MNSTFILCVFAPLNQPPPGSAQNYPLHGNEVNGFHSAPTTYSHTPAINGEGIMGKKNNQLIRPGGEERNFYRHQVWLNNCLSVCLSAANRGTTAGSSGDEIGKALASVSINSWLAIAHKSSVHCVFARNIDWYDCRLQIYPSDHNSNNFNSAPSTPGSPQAIAGMNFSPFIRDQFLNCLLWVFFFLFILQVKCRVVVVP